MASFSGTSPLDQVGYTSRDQKHDSMEPCGPTLNIDATVPELNDGSKRGTDFDGLGILASGNHNSMDPLQQAGAMAKMARAASRKAKKTTIYLDSQAQEDFQLTQLYLSKYGRPSVIPPELPDRKSQVIVQNQELEDSIESVWEPPFAFEEHLSPGKSTSVSLSTRTPLGRHQSSPSAVTPISQRQSPLEDMPTWTTLPPRRPYKYKALTSRSDIRLLTVTVSELDGKLYFQLPRQRLNDCPPYQAVSYTWGGKARTKAIYEAYSGNILYVTDNCEAAIRSLHNNGQRRLWIDAICINQEDVDERSAQVAQMADVFRNATETVIYLGEADNHTAALVRWPRTRRLASGLGAETESVVGERAYQHAGALLQRPWFTRTWIIQEVLLSKNLLMQAGQEVIDIIELSSLIKHHGPSDQRISGIMDILHRYGSELSKQTRYAHRVAWRDLNRQSALQSIVPSKGYLKYWQLFNLLMETRQYGCQDPRDKLYALISLFDGDPPPELVPNYSLPVDEVYANISRYLIASESTTLVLSLAKGAHYNSPLPTWAIDWRSVPDLDNYMDRYSHHAGLIEGQQQIPALPSNRNELRLRGRRVAVVHLALGDSDEEDKIRSTSTVKELDWLIPLPSCPQIPAAKMRLPGNTWPLDLVCVLIGFEVPFVLREVVDGWLLVGECYIEGLMAGEAVSDVDWTRINDERAMLPLEDFNIY